MKHLLILILLVLAGCKSQVNPDETSRIPKFTELKEGDRLHLFFESGSCIGVKDEDSDIGYAFMKDYMVRNATVLPSEDEKKWSILKLEKEDKIDLDDLIEYWQGDIDNYGCTVSVYLTITYVRNGKVIYESKRYIDSSGDYLNGKIIGPSDIFIRCIERYRTTQNKE